MACPTSQLDGCTQLLGDCWKVRVCVRIRRRVCAFAPCGSGPRMFIARNIITVVAKHFRCAEVLSQQMNYELPYGYIITVSVKRFRRAEVLSQPSFQPA